MKIVDQSRNGVRVLVYKSAGGSVVEADCKCYGHPLRVHSNQNCPFIKKYGRINKN